METNLLQQFTQGLNNYLEEMTMTHLGNRQEYIGLSDIAKALECPRSAVLNKVCKHKHSDNVYATAEALLPLARGHALEEVAKHAFWKNIEEEQYVITGLELSFTYKEVPIKAHFDIVLVDFKKNHVYIIEVKSMEAIPFPMHASYELQANAQATFMQKYWHKKAFHVDGYDKFSFPELCKACCGMQPLKNPIISAHLLCLTLKNAELFSGYEPNDIVLELVYSKALELWQYMKEFKEKNISEIPYSRGFHVLCGFCAHNSDCPKFSGIQQPEYNEVLQRLADLKNNKDFILYEINQIEASLKAEYPLLKTQDWVTSSDFRFKVSQQKGRTSLDKDLLYFELSTLLKSPELAGQILDRCTKQGQSFEKLCVTRVM